jgi:hypothetical protein
LLIIPALALAAEKDFRGQLSLQSNTWNRSGIWYHDGRLQYIPNLRISNSLSMARLVDFEASFYLYVNLEDGETSDDFRPYRLNLRYATKQSEIQLGLQKINFGPAQLLRSLMWFDRQNPTDPLNFAEGVWGIRYRYYFLNNANIWLWGLYGNDKPKGYEAHGTEKKIPEFGFRTQLPVSHGEIGCTFHTRTINDERRYDAFRFALDGRWDWVLGWWFEAVLSHRDLNFPYEFGKMLTLGADYTFGIGNGLYLLGEHMINQTSEDLLSMNQQYRFSAIMLNYPLGMFDNLSLMAFYSWDTDDIVQYASWQRTYDKIALNLALFHYPNMQISVINTTGGGYGAQLMLIYNH